MSKQLRAWITISLKRSSKALKKLSRTLQRTQKKLGGDVGNTFSDYESQVNKELDKLDKLDKTEDPAEKRRHYKYF